MAVKVNKEAKGKGPVFIQKVIKGDTYMVMAHSTYQPEDEFVGLYYTTDQSQRVFLQPPFDLKQLAKMTSQNNILDQCVEAMEVNIDGTGHELVPVEDGKDKDAAEEKRLLSFINEPYPGQSLINLRRRLRRDLESTGNGYMEVCANAEGEIMTLRHTPSHSIRLVRLDAPVQVPRTILRDGKEISLKLWERERRYAQKVGPSSYFYYREYGSSREIHRDTGEWETKEKPIDPKDRGTSLIHFTLNEDVETPYGIPRWINQLPSVIGSRKAEEHNLEFFDAGGLPPAIIFIQGGTLASEMADQLRMYLSGQMKNRHRAAIVEAQSSSGSLESTGSVKVSVERFGAEATKDSMFATYDKNAEEHVRVSFRLPPLFIGKAADYSFASAQVSYMIAEAQVFGPERTEFDEKFNKTVMKALKSKTCAFKSKPITLTTVTDQISALGLVKDMVDQESLISQVNQMASMSLEQAEAPDEVADMEAKGTVQNKLHEEKTKIDAKYAPHFEKAKALAKSPVKKMFDLANDFLRAEGLVPAAEVSEEQRTTIRKQADELEGEDRAMFARFVSINLVSHQSRGE